MHGALQQPKVGAYREIVAAKLHAVETGIRTARLRQQHIANRNITKAATGAHANDGAHRITTGKFGDVDGRGRDPHATAQNGDALPIAFTGVAQHVAPRIDLARRGE